LGIVQVLTVLTVGTLVGVGAAVGTLSDVGTGVGVNNAVGGLGGPVGADGRRSAPTAIESASTAPKIHGQTRRLFGCSGCTERTLQPVVRCAQDAQASRT